MRHAEKSCPVCQVPLAKGNSELLVPSVSIPTYTHHTELSSCNSSPRARSSGWVQLSRSPCILADSRQVRILLYPRNYFYNFIQMVQHWKMNHSDLQRIYYYVNGGGETH